MRKVAHLVQSRHGIFYFRYVPPVRLRQQSPELPSEIRISLRTRDPREAMRQSHFLAYHYQTLAMGKDSTTPFYPQLTHVFPDIHGREHKLEYTPEEATAALQMIQALQTGQAQPAESAPALPEAPAPMEAVPNKAYLLSTLIKTYGVARPKRSWEFEQEPALRDFREFVAVRQIMARFDMTASSLSEQSIRRYRDYLVKTPAGVRGLREYWRDRKEPDGPPMAPKTVNKKLSHIRGFLVWLRRGNYIRTDLAPMLYDAPVDETQTASYQPFTRAELKSLFESEEFRHPATPWRYWLPVLGLYTGARLDELCQLFVADVRPYQADPDDPPSPHTCLHITRAISPEDKAKLPEGEGKSLKTADSERWIPLHPKLIELGFLAFVDAQRAAGHVRLFPDLSYDAKNGYARKASRWFQDFTRSQGVYQPRTKVFHSFRGTLNRALQRTKMEETMRETLLGHKPQSVNRQNYGNILGPEHVLEHLGLVDFGVVLERYPGTS